MSNPFGSKPKPGYMSPHTGEADNLSFDRLKGALGNIPNPQEYKLGSQGANAYKFTMPTALDEKTGLFSQMFNNTQTGLQRNQQATLDKAKRDSMLTGTFSPGQFKNLALQSQQNVDDTLGKYGTQGAFDLATERAKYEAGNQQAQAGENRAWEDLGLKNDVQNKGYFTDLLKTLIEGHVKPYAGAQGATPGSSGWLPGLISGGANAAASFFCLPRGTEIEIDKNNFVKVEDVKVGDFVRGGRVLKTRKIKRKEGHKFYQHNFKTGSVIMSAGHPYFGALVNKEPVENPSEHTYDLLTSEGYYYVNGIKLGSTIQ